jgi:uncharacterized protein
MSQISILYRLQQIDSQLDSARSSLQNVELELNDKTILELSEQNAKQAEQQYQAELKRLREAENKSSDVRLKMEFSESSLYGGKIQNPKELQDLQKEITSLKNLIAALEDREFEAMMAVEEAETKLSSAIETLRIMQGKQIEQSAILNGEKTKFLGQIERLESERKATLSPINSTDLALYEQLRKGRNGVAVVKISSRACGACGATLTAAVIQSTQSTGQIVRCPTCGRILYPG